MGLESLNEALKRDYGLGIAVRIGVNVGHLRSRRGRRLLICNTSMQRAHAPFPCNQALSRDHHASVQGVQGLRRRRRGPTAHSVEAL